MEKPAMSKRQPQKEPESMLTPEEIEAVKASVRQQYRGSEYKPKGPSGPTNLSSLPQGNPG